MKKNHKKYYYYYYYYYYYLRLLLSYLTGLRLHIINTILFCRKKEAFFGALGFKESQNQLKCTLLSESVYQSLTD